MKKFLFAAALMCAGCCSTTKEAADALSEAWVLIEPDALAGMEARINALERSDEEKAMMKASERRHIEAFDDLVEEVKRSVR